MVPPLHESGDQGSLYINPFVNPLRHCQHHTSCSDIVDIMMDNGDNSSLSDDEHLTAGLNEDVDVDAGMLDAMYDLSAGVSDNEYENDGRDDSAESQQGWNILTGSRRPSSVTISLDGVDSRLLNKLDMKFQRLSNESRKSSLARRRIATCRECPLVIS